MFSLLRLSLLFVLATAVRSECIVPDTDGSTIISILPGMPFGNNMGIILNIQCVESLQWDEKSTKYTEDEVHIYECNKADKWVYKKSGAEFEGVQDRCIAPPVITTASPAKGVCHFLRSFSYSITPEKRIPGELPTKLLYDSDDIVTLKCLENSKWWSTENPAEIHQYKCLADGGWKSVETGKIFPKTADPLFTAAVPDYCYHCRIPTNTSITTVNARCIGSDTSRVCSANVQCPLPDYVVKNTDVNAASYTCDKTTSKWVDSTTKQPVENEDIVCEPKRSEQQKDCYLTTLPTVTYSPEGKLAGQKSTVRVYPHGTTLSLKCIPYTAWFGMSALNKADVHKYSCQSNGSWVSLETGKEYPLPTKEMTPQLTEWCQGCKRPQQITNVQMVTEVCTKVDGTPVCGATMNCQIPGQVVNNTNVPSKTYNCDFKKQKFIDPLTNEVVENKDINCI